MENTMAPVKIQNELTESFLVKNGLKQWDLLAQSYLI
jgi:hypothetical protein